jgi:DNA-directed RNA polymerase subunit RPC12/RpoP
MHETTSQAQVPSCPHCGGKQFFRSRRIGVKDWFLHYVLFQNPYRCAACDERFFSVIAIITRNNCTTTSKPNPSGYWRLREKTRVVYKTVQIRDGV